MKEQADEINRLNGVIMTKDCIINDLKRRIKKLEQKNFKTIVSIGFLIVFLWLMSLSIRLGLIW